MEVNGVAFVIKLARLIFLEGSSLAREMSFQVLYGCGVWIVTESVMFVNCPQYPVAWVITHPCPINKTDTQHKTIFIP